MAEGKYGRLFTEADVRKLLRYAAHRGEEIGVEALGHDPDGQRLDPGERLLVEYEAEADKPAIHGIGRVDPEGEYPVHDPFPLRLTFPPDEPLFLLRGQDLAAPRAIATQTEREQEYGGYGDYYSAASAAGADEAHLRAVERAAVEMYEWQAANPDRVKVPD